MADLFKEIIPSILTTKKNVLQTEEDIKKYPPFIVNRALSNHMDCVLYANEMNLYHELDNDMQYSYFLNSIRPMNRKFQTWNTNNVDETIQYIKKYFGYTNEKAKDVLGILSDKQIAEIKEKIKAG
jgi:hypothetical protein